MKAHLADLVGKLEPEQPQPRKRFSYQKDPLIEGFKRLTSLRATGNQYFLGIDELIELVNKHTKHICASEAQLQAFLDAAPACYAFIENKEMSGNLVHGVYLSALAAKLPRVTLTVSKPLMYLGAAFAGRQLIFNGYAGQIACWRMRKGAVQFNDGVDNLCGWEMRGGNITIQRRAGEGLGGGMGGGVINCYGPADHGIAGLSEGGRINLFNTTKFDVGESCKAKIYHNGVRVK